MASDKRMGCGSIIMILFAVAFIGGNCSKQDDKQTMDEKINAWKTRDNSGGAYAVMQDFVKQRLKAPASADFPWSGEQGVTISNLGNQEYRVVGFVDAQNSFGAKIRTRYIGIVQKTDADNWQLKELVLLQ